jgi:hypothetical protein
MHTEVRGQVQTGPRRVLVPCCSDAGPGASPRCVMFSAAALVPVRFVRCCRAPVEFLLVRCCMALVAFSISERTHVGPPAAHHTLS